MLIWAGTIVIIAGVIYSGILLLLDKNGFAVVGFCLAATVAGIALMNAPRVAKAGFSSKGTTVGFDFQNAVDTVQSKAAEVQQIGDQVQKLATQVGTDAQEVKTLKNQTQAFATEMRDAEKRIGQSETNVFDMRSKVQSDVNDVRALKDQIQTMSDGIRQAYRSLFEVLLLSLNTRNLFPPPQFVTDEMNKRLGLLAPFAYKDHAEAQAAVAQIHALAALAQQKVPLAPSTPKP
jgi:septal ring factor EnvC (AmiA/AmiB activator)